MFGVDVFPADKYPRLAAWTAAMQRLDFVRKMWISPKLYNNFIAGRRAGEPPFDQDMDEETLTMQKRAG